MKLFTIGTSKKKPEEFFDLLMNNKVKTVIDVRLMDGFSSGYARKSFLPYFLKQIAGINYCEMKQCAPTKGIYDAYRDEKITWREYRKQYWNIIKERDIIKDFSKKILNRACLLCYEAESDYCHRRILAEYLKRHFDEIEIVHL